MQRRRTQSKRDLQSAGQIILSLAKSVFDGHTS